ncbi:hypothetical protein Lalb_Chr10g0092291 [Lupinus albus]|uniref:Uncharacterized protein n=1 Tax=Lupinus albus TaxID=3870 RepID=A0A6A4PU22_LUPAL|nr:hypothetical protein Lalb_Chr10g0092291 [Lupinus albus]
MGKSLTMMGFFVLFFVLASGLNIGVVDHELGSVVGRPCVSNAECSGCPPCEVDCLKPCCLCLRGQCQCSSRRGLHN